MRGQKAAQRLDKETRQIWKLAWPIMVGILTHMVFHIVDLYWIGYLGGKALAATAAAGALSFVLWTGSGIVRTGGVAIISQAFGRKDDARLRAATGESLVLGGLLSAVFFLPAYLFLEELIAFYGLDPETATLAVTYAKVGLLGVPFWYLGEAAFAYFTGIGRTRVPMTVGIVCNTVNLVLDPFLIFGWGPFPELGLVGAAWATLASSILMAAMGIGWQRLACNTGLRDLVPRWRAMLEMARIGFPATLRDFSRPVVGMIMYRIIAPFGAEVVAAFGVSLKIIGLMIVYVAGLNVALTSLTGQRIGAGKVHEVEGVLGKGLRIGLTLHMGIALFLTVFAGPALGLFDSTGRIVAVGIPIIRILAWAITAVVVTRVFGAAFTGSGDTKPVMVASLSAHWLVQLPLAYLGIWWFQSPVGVWLAIATARMAETCILMGFYRTGRWKKVAVG